MTEFCDSCDKSEADAVGSSFYGRVKSFQVTENRLLFRLTDVVQNRRVVLIDKDHRRSSLRCIENQIPKLSLRIIAARDNTKRIRTVFQRINQSVFELFDGRTFPAAHIQMNDGVRLPVIRLVINGKPPEKLFLSLKEGLQGGNCQRLPETARTGEKIHGICRFNQFPDVFRFIDIQKAAVPQTFERINAGCQKLLLHDDFPSFLCNLSPERRLVKSMDSF